MLVGLVMADDAAGDCAELAVARHVPGDAADDGTLDAALGLRRDGGTHCAHQGRKQYDCFHDDPSSIKKLTLEAHDCSANILRLAVLSVRGFALDHRNVGTSP